MALQFNDQVPLRYRSPRLRVIANGQVLHGACSASVISNGHYSADSFSVSVALGADPWADASFWSSQTSIEIEIQISLDVTSVFKTLIVGDSDSIVFEPLQGLIEIRGRDLSAALIESQTQETFANRTSSEIAVLFAERHGLVPQVDRTNTTIGRFYEDDREGLTLSQFCGFTTEWDVLTSLARQENFDLWVDGRKLHFQSAPAKPPAIMTLNPSDVIDVKFERLIGLGRGISVTVRSWNSNQQALVSQTVSSSSSSGTTSQETATASYWFVYPNLTPDSAAALARQRLSEITRHERSVDLVLPGELSLTPRDSISLVGSGTAFDQPYCIDSIERSIAPHSGFRERIRASMCSPGTTMITSS